MLKSLLSSANDVDDRSSLVVGPDLTFFDDDDTASAAGRPIQYFLWSCGLVLLHAIIFIVRV